MMTLAELTTKVLQHIGKEFLCPLSKNKGRCGLLLETITGVPHSSAALDCSDGELKTYPIKYLKDGTRVPKQTIAVCKLSKEDLKDHEFEDSRPAKKMSHMLIVPFEEKDGKVTFLEPYTFRLTDHPELAATLKADYDAIRAQFREDGTLKCRTGTILQNRPKNRGHGATGRAFYLRKDFMKQVMPIHSSQ